MLVECQVGDQRNQAYQDRGDDRAAGAEHECHQGDDQDAGVARKVCQSVVSRTCVAMRAHTAPQIQMGVRDALARVAWCALPGCWAAVCATPQVRHLTPSLYIVPRYFSMARRKI